MDPFDQQVGLPDQDHKASSPSVSVIIPAFNAERTLAETLESALAQTFEKIEIIVIDDGSTDGTREIAQSFAARDPRVRVIVQENGGVADARNAGIRAARAPLVSPLDADDVWHPCFLEKVHAALTAGGEDTLFAFAYSREMDERGIVLASMALKPLQGYAFNRFMIKNFVGNGSGMLFRRAAALAVGGYERRLQHEFNAVGCEDWLLQMRLAARGNVAAVCEYLVGYRKLPGTMSADQVRMYRSRTHAYQILFDEMRCWDTLGARWALGRTLAVRFVLELEAGHFGVALMTLPRALALDGWGSLAVFWRETKTRVRMVLRIAARPVALPLAVREPRSQRVFAEYEPLEGSRRPQPGLELRRIERMAEEDRKEIERKTRIAKDQSETSADMARQIDGGSGASER
jgi:glycosyltransferase involved in cell wall biosynthesis